MSTCSFYPEFRTKGVHINEIPLYNHSKVSRALNQELYSWFIGTLLKKSNVYTVCSYLKWWSSKVRHKAANFQPHAILAITTPIPATKLVQSHNPTRFKTVAIYFSLDVTHDSIRLLHKMVPFLVSQSQGETPPMSIATTNLIVT